jgi:hypothetical protein
MRLLYFSAYGCKLQLLKGIHEIIFLKVLFVIHGPESYPDIQRLHCSQSMHATRACTIHIPYNFSLQCSQSMQPESALFKILIICAYTAPNPCIQLDPELFLDPYNHTLQCSQALHPQSMRMCNCACLSLVS